MQTAGGNFVALEIGYNRYALYGHLIPGSLKVKIGDSVKRG
jgi:murein DD-endopeptidase MepM/ murein hydrolase activator NlpD